MLPTGINSYRRRTLSSSCYAFCRPISAKSQPGTVRLTSVPRWRRGTPAEADSLSNYTYIRLVPVGHVDKIFTRLSSRQVTTIINLSFPQIKHRKMSLCRTCANMDICKPHRRGAQPLTYHLKAVQEASLQGCGFCCLLWEAASSMETWSR